MAFQGNKFIFDGVPGEQYGLMLANINNANQDAGKIGGTWKVHEDRIARRSVGLDYGVTANDPLSFPITMVAMDDNKHFDRNDIAAIAGWLTGHQSFKKLVVLQDDMEDVYYKCRITKLDAVEIGMRVVGFTATVACDGPYAYRSTAPQLIAGSVEGTTSTYFNPSNIKDYFYPTLLLTDVIGDVSIINVDDGGREFKLDNAHFATTTIQKSVVGGAVIRLNDVSPLEHTVAVNVSSKNLYFSNTTKSVLVQGTLTLETKANTSEFVLNGATTAEYAATLSNDIPLKAGTYAVSLHGTNIIGSDWDRICIVTASGAYLVNYVRNGAPKTFTLEKDTTVSVQMVFAAETTYKNVACSVQIEEGTAATAYTPYVPDLTAVTVTAQGKNLLPHADCGFINGGSSSFSVTKTDTGYSMIGSLSSSCFGVVRVGSLAELGGKTVTKSASIVGNGLIDCVVCASDCSNRTEIYASRDTVTIPSASEYPDGYIFALRLYGDTNADTTAVVTYDNIQIEIGDTATEYEPYKQSAGYTPTEDGTREVKSISPTMTLLADNPGVVMSCEYDTIVDQSGRDITIDCMRQIMTASDGVNLYECWNTDIPKYFPRLVRGNNRLTLTGECQLEICGDVSWNIGH